MAWIEAYRQALEASSAAAGYYNHNVRVNGPDGPVVVRIPIPGAPAMDLRLWNEPEILAVVSDHQPYAPRLLHVSQNPRFQVHAFIDGEVLDQRTPRGVAVPPHVLPDIARFFAGLAAFPTAKLPARPDSWPADRDTPAFAGRLCDESKRVYETNLRSWSTLYDRLLIPADPFAPAEAARERIRPRPFTLVHSDIHRKNIIVNGGQSYFLDWELALYGDPVYDLAVHLHKFQYQAVEQESFIRLWEKEMPPTHTANHAEDLQAYLLHEEIKSAVVDSVRYAEGFAGGRTHYSRDAMATKLTATLARARRHWGDTTPVSRPEVVDALSHGNGNGRS